MIFSFMTCMVKATIVVTSTEAQRKQLLGEEKTMIDSVFTKEEDRERNA